MPDWLPRKHEYFRHQTWILKFLKWLHKYFWHFRILRHKFLDVLNYLFSCAHFLQTFLLNDFDRKFSRHHVLLVVYFAYFDLDSSFLQAFGFMMQWNPLTSGLASERKHLQGVRYNHFWVFHLDFAGLVLMFLNVLVLDVFVV